MSDSVKAALWTALFTFLSVFATTAIGWVGDVAEWANGAGTTAFPSVSVLAYGAVSALTAAGAGFLNWVVRATQKATGVGAGTVPSYGELPQL